MKGQVVTSGEIRALLARDAEAVVVLVERLFAQIAAQASQIAALHAEIAAVQAQNAALEARVKELEGRLATDSHNSSKPPSSDSFGTPRRTRSLRQPSGKKPGGQPGHPGTTLRPVDTPDHVVVSSPSRCPACGASLAGIEPKHVERRQVHDVPPVKLEVTEYRAETKTCPCCGEATTGTFPAGVTQPVQYGERLQALGVYLHGYHLVPYERTSELLEDLFGAAPSEGTLNTALERCAAGLVETEETIKKGLRQAAVTQHDETSVRIGGKRHWVHESGTARLTHYGCHARRGKAATEAIDILPRFAGRAIHDAWSAYFQYPCQHGLCNAHHLRELTYLQEQEQQAWAGEMADLLRTIYRGVTEVRAAGADQLEEATRHAFEQRYQEILTAGYAANPASAEPRAPPGKRGPKPQSKARNLLDRLSEHRRAVLAFMDDFRVPFDNNLAERDLRMLKVQQKIAGGFRSTDGAIGFCRIRSYVSTMRKQGKPVLAAIQHVFAGTPFIPRTQPE